MEQYTEEWNVLLLNNFRLSEVWSKPPITRARRVLTESAFERALRYSAAWRKRLIDARNSAWRMSKLSGFEADADLKTLHNVAVSKVTANEARRKTTHRRYTPLETFDGTINTLIGFLDYCDTLQPQRTTNSQGKRLTRKQISKHDAYCQLCWRQTEYAAGLKKNRNFPFPERRLSRRFCSCHDPSVPNSEYRRDYAYKEAFELELAALTRRKKSEYNIRFEPASWAEEDLRRAAYALVHSRLKGTREQVLILRIQGKSLNEIAEALKISRRAVSKALSTAKKQIETMEHIRWGSVTFPL
ncbi:MAG: sigma factor-like helix-turn-helix DNA-binding protein [Pseudomonadota bacterium]